jgi:hypothetical protein
MRYEDHMALIEATCRARWNASKAHVPWDEIPEDWKTWHRKLAFELLTHLNKITDELPLYRL